MKWKKIFVNKEEGLRGGEETGKLRKIKTYHVLIQISWMNVINMYT